MAKETTSFQDATAKGGSLNNDHFGMGENADGSFETFPLSQLAKRTAERDRQDAADQYALEQSENGFADPFLEDDSDLDLDDTEDTEED